MIQVNDNNNQNLTDFMKEKRKKRKIITILF